MTRKPIIPVAVVWLLALLAAWPLIANPGYFSHDELQWAAYAGSDGPIRWVPWWGFDAFQYRPLTFNLWLGLSRWLFDAPHAFHALLVAWGAGNAAMLFALSRRLGVALLPAAAGALMFALGPYAVCVHGWVGTIADLAWVGCALGIGLLCAHGVRDRVLVAGTLLLTLAALLAKEAAVAIPAVLVVAWACAPLHEGGVRRRLAGAAIASGALVLVYLALRLGVLSEASQQVSQYRIDVGHAPLRWAEYQLFTFIPVVFESFNTFLPGLRVAWMLAALLWLGVVAACWLANWRLAAFFVLGGIAALAPVLVLPVSSNQYGYGFAALGAATVAAAWPHARTWGRIAIALAAAACLAHGFFVMRMMRHVGEVQAVFSPALARAVDANDGELLRLRVAPDAERWIFVRLSHEVPAYRGVPIGDRVELVADDAPADAVISREGRINPL